MKRIPFGFQISHINGETGEPYESVEYWTLQQMLDWINQDVLEEGCKYDQADWQDGWDSLQQSERTHIIRHIWMR
tara:strand:- start:987 stop:1211 length:225 start_codon:yes stop_codon:yes gene_type:complete